MAPELLWGGLLKKPCDIYTLGMTVYEVRRPVSPHCAPESAEVE
jgi:hypothetical protein